MPEMSRWSLAPPLSARAWRRSWPRYVPDALGADVDSISVVHGQTDRLGPGMGSFATRTTVMTGAATHLAGTALKRRLLSIAADLLEVGAEDLLVDRGRIFVADSPGEHALTFAEVAAAVAPGGPGVASSRRRPDRDRIVHLDPHDLSIRVASRRRQHRCRDG